MFLLMYSFNKNIKFLCVTLIVATFFLSVNCNKQKLTGQALWGLRSNSQNCTNGRVMFAYGPECADEELSKDLYRSRRIDLKFNLTFMGHQFSSIWINQHGFVSFQESFYGTSVTAEDWPQSKYPYVDDPIFIAPFYAQTDLFSDKTDDTVTTKYGRVLYKVIDRKDLQQQYTEEEKFEYEMSMRILNEAQAQIREAVASAEVFVANHAVIATWKSLTFAGNSEQDIDRRPRNTFQLAIVTDTNYTFAFLNYQDVQWYASASLGGNPETGLGGKAAKIGFNRGNGTLWYGIKPYSENAQLIQNLENTSNVMIPGRFIYRIDEWIQPGGCTESDFDEEKTLYIWPRYANMLGGQEVNITGPCFEKHKFFICKWGDGYDAPTSIGETPIIDNKHSYIRGRCIQPIMYFVGRLNLSISFDNGSTYLWKAEYTIVDPLRYPAKVELSNINDWHAQASPPRLIVRWDRHELSYAESDLVDIELFGYYEDDSGPHWDELQVIAKQVLNKGSYGFDVAPNRAKNQTLARTYKLGAIRISLYDSHFDPSLKVIVSKHIWSSLHPIGWWRNDEMKFYYDKKSYLLGSSRGKNWAEDQCRWWHQYRKNDRYWMDELEICPPTLLFAIGDIGVWAPDPNCNMYGSQYNELNCLQHKEAVHCVVTMRRTSDGAGNRCCYGVNGNLLYTNDTIWGSTPDRYHSLGVPPYNAYGKVPGLSHYFHDIVPFYLCCHWSNLCESYLYLRQTKDAKGYKEPRPAVAYGDPHIMTFDGKDYTFNGKGEFHLFKSKKHNFQLQGRFEQPPNATFCLQSSKGQINATRITAIVAGQDDSDIVEVRTRLHPSQSRILKCDVLINGKVYYFNYTEEKTQLFKNVFVMSPLNDLHQSNITIMFNTSGVGVQVACMHGLLHVRVSAPYSMFKDTSGLFGYWDNITANDFLGPDGMTTQLTSEPKDLYQSFGMSWRMIDESESLFTYSGSWSFDTFHDNKPIIREWQRFRPWFTQSEIPFPSNVSFTQEEWHAACDGDEQCLYDSKALGSLEVGQATKNAHKFYKLLHESMKAVNSCGIYLMKGGIRETTKGNYLTGSKMKLSCEKGYMLFGWPEFTCHWNGTWLPTNGQWLAQFRDWPYCEHYHITAIRWSAIVISSLWLIFIIIALIRHCILRKKRDGFISNRKEKDIYNDPTTVRLTSDELEAMKGLRPDNYSKDGYETRTQIKTSSSRYLDSKANNLEKNQSLSQEVLNSECQIVDHIETPAIIIQIPSESMKKGQISAKIFGEESVNLDDTENEQSLNSFNSKGKNNSPGKHFQNKNNKTSSTPSDKYSLANSENNTSRLNKFTPNQSPSIDNKNIIEPSDSWSYNQSNVNNNVDPYQKVDISKVRQVRRFNNIQDPNEGPNDL